MTDRDPLPHNQDAEQHLLGMLICRPAGVDEVDALESHHFFYPSHGRIFRTIQELRDGNKDVFPSLVAEMAGVDIDPDLTDVGGGEYIGDLCPSVISLHNPLDYALHLIELWRRRQAIGLIDSFRPALTRDDLADRRPVSEQVATLINGLDRIAEIDPEDPGLIPIADAGDRLLASVSDVGSSPRVRGTVSCRTAGSSAVRFIPARAGNGRADCRGDRRYPVHPRACGERRR